jgi:hypothetical protein
MTSRRRPIRSVCAGGCNFPARPSRNALEEPVYWTPEADLGKVLLTATPLTAGQGGDLSAALDESASRLAVDGLHLIHGIGPSAVHVVRLTGAAADQPLAALVPLDADAPDRLSAISRLWRALHSPSPPGDARLTPQRRRRLRHMLQALDGRTFGATYRDIAEVMFGVPRVASDPWKTSALRDTTVRLVRDGFAMVSGGYRDLLRHRRRT